jgi:hypothetical protein
VIIRLLEQYVVFEQMQLNFVGSRQGHGARERITSKPEFVRLRRRRVQFDSNALHRAGHNGSTAVYRDGESKL